jgi:hypothetical protein
LINLLCPYSALLKGRGSQIFLITETLGPGHLTFPVDTSDSALKSCFYYPVCRCQRTSGLRYFRRQKNPTLSSGFESRFRASVPGQN